MCYTIFAKGYIGGIAMKEIIMYESCDGKIFDSERDCWKHEKGLIDKATYLRVYKRNGERIQNLFKKTDYNKSYLVVIPNESALLDVKQLCYWLGFYVGIDSIGTWYYAGDNDKWVKRA
jgi:hypothetical protein